MSAPRNVLFITLDQWRADALGCAGNSAIATPHLDRLANDGMRFSQHFASASPCGPSRAALLTGMYQHNNGVVRNGTPLDPRFTNLALESRKAGYEPTLFGYTDTAADPRRHHPNDPALKTYESVLAGFTPALYLPELPLAWLAHLQRQGYDFGRSLQQVYQPADGPGPSAPTGAPARFKAEHGISAFLTDALLDFISMRRDRPWFAHAAYIRPHPPFIAPAPYHTRYAAQDMPLPQRAPSAEQEASQHPLTRHYLEQQQQATFFARGDGLVTDMADPDLAQLRATYYGMVSEVDDQIGRLTQQLRQWGLYDSTLVVITSDHGEMLGDHWMLGKEGYFKEAFHVPLIVRDPSAAAQATRGTSFDGFTEAVDVMPTILQWMDLALPRQCDGRSLLALCHQQAAPDWRQEVHWEFDYRYTKAELALGQALDTCGLAVLRDADYQYVHFADLPPLFFDLTADPHCLRNRADDPALATTVLRYTQRMLSWHMKSNARELTGMLVGKDGVSTRS